jgi:hypothetical protein
LFYAVANRSKKIAKLIVDAGADVNLADTLGVTPLMMACLNKEKVVRACVCESSIGRWGAPNAASHDMPLRGLWHLSPPLPCACPLLPVWSRRSW